jgi:hypothetical protein
VGKDGGGGWGGPEAAAPDNGNGAINVGTSSS